MKKTKIICTVGPASDNSETIEKLNKSRNECFKA